MPAFIRELFRLSLPVAMLAAGAFGFVTLSSVRDAPQGDSGADAREPVETRLVERYDGSVPLRADGVVVPFREVRLATEVAGRISTKPDVCRAGRFVEQGTVLLEIDRTDYELEVRRFERELKQSQDSLEELDVEIQNTTELLKLADEDVHLRQRELKRLQALAARDVVSESEMDAGRQAELSSRNARTGVRNQRRLHRKRRSRMEAVRDVVRTRLEKARLDLARCEITSPMDGVIVEEYVEVNSYVQTGATLLTIEDTSSVEVRCNLRVEQLFRILNQPHLERQARRQDDESYELPPQPVDVQYELAGQTFVWSGVLSRYDGIGLDEKTRTAPCRVRVDKPREVRFAGSAGPVESGGPRALVRGMYVTLQMELESDAPLLLVPELSLRPGNRLWRVRNEQLDELHVRVVRVLPESVVVSDPHGDLDAGDAVVVSPLPRASAGLKVREADGP